MAVFFFWQISCKSTYSFFNGIVNFIKKIKLIYLIKIKITSTINIMKKEAKREHSKFS